MIDTLKDFYLQNQDAINLLLVGLGVAILDKLIEKSKAESNTVLTLVLNTIKKVLPKKK